MDELLIKYLVGDADADEQKRVQQWLEADERNIGRMESYKAAWDASKQFVPLAPDWQEAFSRFRQRVRETAESRPADKRGRDKKPTGRRIIIGLLAKWQVAAFLTGILGLAAVLFVVVSKKKSNTGGTFALTTISHPGSVTLPDGTVVKVGDHSSLSYGFQRRTGDRVVHLNGQAFFSVTGDASRPFIVRVNDLTIKVLGTSFTVREIKDSTLVEMVTGAVVVSKGRVRQVIKAGDTLRAIQGSDDLLVSAANVNVAPTGSKSSAARQTTTPAAGKRVVSADFPGHREDPQDIMKSIIAEMVHDKIVARMEDIDWLGLDSSQFIVNDKRLPDVVLRRYRLKYIKPDGQGYYYGAVKVTGHGYFFTKQELYNR